MLETSRRGSRKIKNWTKWHRVRGPIQILRMFRRQWKHAGRGWIGGWNMDKIGRRPQKEASRRINRSARNTRDVWFNKKSPFIGGWGGNRVAAPPPRNKFSFHEAIKRAYAAWCLAPQISPRNRFYQIRIFFPPPLFYDDNVETFFSFVENKYFRFSSRCSLFIVIFLSFMKDRAPLNVIRLRGWSWRRD